MDKVIKPAFPVTEVLHNGNTYPPTNTGMTFREYAAVAIMQGLIMDANIDLSAVNIRAVQLADELIKTLEGE